MDDKTIYMTFSKHKDYFAADSSIKQRKEPDLELLAGLTVDDLTDNETSTKLEVNYGNLDREEKEYLRSVLDEYCSYASSLRKTAQPLDYVEKSNLETLAETYKN